MDSKQVDYDYTLLKKIMDNPENKSCFDCGKLYPCFVSVNNAVFLCEKCSKLHKTFGENSEVKSLTQDDLSENDIKVISKGGNQRLRYFLLDFSLPQNCDPNYKYFIYAMDYYRRLLKFEAEGGLESGKQEPVKPDSLLGLECMRSSIPVHRQFEEFTMDKEVTNTRGNVKFGQQNNQTNQERVHYNNSSTSHNQQRKVVKEKNFFDEVTDFFNFTGEKMAKAFEDVQEDIRKSEIEKKLQDAGKKTKEAFEEFGEMTNVFFRGVFEDTKKFFDGESETQQHESNHHFRPVEVEETKSNSLWEERVSNFYQRPSIQVTYVSKNQNRSKKEGEDDVLIETEILDK